MLFEKENRRNFVCPGRSLVFISFLPARRYASADLSYSNVSVSPSVIVSKRLNLCYNFFDHLVAPSFELLQPLH